MSDIVNTACATMDEAIAELIKLRAEVAALKEERDHWRASASAGHTESCFICGKGCDGATGNASKWPLALPYEGVMRWHHIGCIMRRLRERDDARQALASIAEAVQSSFDDSRYIDDVVDAVRALSPPQPETQESKDDGRS